MTINIIFDGPPSESGRFVEVEDDNGKSISVGEWIERPDGYWALRIPGVAKPTTINAMRIERGLDPIS